MTPPIPPWGRGAITSGRPPAADRFNHRPAPSVPSGLRVTPDHLELVQALLRAGRPGRALEMLDAVWRHDLADEHSWYFRLWALAAEGRALEALESARLATAALPGSAAIAYFHAALERSAGDPTAAVEAALRAAAILPGRPEPETLLSTLLGERAEGTPDPGPTATRLDRDPDHIPSPLAIALAGLGLLHPAGSERPWRPTLPASEPAADPARERYDRRRLIVLALATVVAGIWSVREPLLAAAGLALTVALVARGRPRSSSAE